MNSAITISKKFIENDDLVILPRKRYEEYVRTEKLFHKRLIEEKDTDEAISVYKKEKKSGKLQFISSLADLG